MSAENTGHFLARTLSESNMDSFLTVEGDRLTEKSGKIAKSIKKKKGFNLIL